MKTIVKVMYSIILIAGFVMAVSEGSPYFWANFVGLAMFGGACGKLGFFNDPHEQRNQH